ncbi:hypothetical protein FC89_GL000170 [Liquorilactobacillus ghanensis DSM 18630]|uniref:Uncharacterized protein n=1 Tax=Liquorilactobacillus ghanensis DSM 18630 TaxID=1423750 RepID=A0A0R1VPL8_9LACO|nr:hypothetical protein [Liquorilactobacillus ghanensis]KRM07729.1 hypothetical protein FC89_GL000170 [Liquorilactobacillus ghanensis DSM 18630]
MKKWMKVLLGVIVAVLILFFAGSEIHEWYVWRTPKYNSTQSTVLLSAEADKLTSEQEEAFYSLSRAAIQTEFKDIKFTNLDDYSLYVRKTKEKHMYYIDYVCKSTVLKMRFDTTMYMRIKNSSLKGNTHFVIYNFKSDLSKF